jgi:hypothetical protein
LLLLVDLLSRKVNLIQSSTRSVRKSKKAGQWPLEWQQYLMLELQDWNWSYIGIGPSLHCQYFPLLFGSPLVIWVLNGFKRGTNCDAKDDCGIDATTVAVILWYREGAGNVWMRYASFTGAIYCFHQLLLQRTTCMFLMKIREHVDPSKSSDYMWYKCFKRLISIVSSCFAHLAIHLLTVIYLEWIMMHD